MFYCGKPRVLGLVANLSKRCAEHTSWRWRLGLIDLSAVFGHITRQTTRLLVDISTRLL
jgi:hypothetical protein